MAQFNKKTSNSTYDIDSYERFTRNIIEVFALVFEPIL